ncbi:MAG: GntR family transcriptional regulator [Firmicutes bacterium]|nr:GntR family transcriptional regulator [Bacillota bacterium]
MNNRIRKDSVIPLYHQLKEILREQIDSRKYKPHQQIPSESELQKAHGLSRATVRKAIDGLVREGFLYRLHGKGTFVAEPRDRLTLDSFTENMRSFGFNPTTVVLENTLLTDVDPELQQKLGIGPEEQVIRLKRLRFIDGEELLLSTSYLPASLCPGLENEEITGSLYKKLAEDHNIVPSWGEDFIEPVIINDEDAKLLNTTPGGPALLVERHAYTAENDLVEICFTLIRGDKSKFYLKHNG